MSRYDNDVQTASVKDALKYNDTSTMVAAPRQIRWMNLIIGITAALVICLAIGVALYYLLRYHKKKLLEGVNIGTEAGIVTTFGAGAPTTDVKNMQEKTLEQ